MKKDGEESSYLPKVLDHDKALPDSDPISHQDFNNFAFVLSPKGKIVIRIIKRSIQHIGMPSSRHPQKASKAISTLLGFFVEEIHSNAAQKEQ